MWLFGGLQDPQRLHWSAIEDEQLKWAMKTLFHSEDTLGLPPSVWMLHSDGAYKVILEGLPEYDRWGSLPKVRATPNAQTRSCDGRDWAAPAPARPWWRRKKATRRKMTMPRVNPRLRLCRPRPLRLAGRGGCPHG